MNLSQLYTIKSKNASKNASKNKATSKIKRQKRPKSLLPFVSGDGLEGIRTPDPLVRSQMLYPLSYKPLRF